MELKVVSLEKPEDVNLVVGQAHFIKTVEDIAEVLAASVPGMSFGVAFCEASGKTLVRSEGNDEQMRLLALNSAQAIAAGHVFVIAVRNGYPINFMTALKMVPEVCRIFCATANPLQVLVAETAQGRGVAGVIDGAAPAGIEGPEDVAWRKEFLRKIGYKR
jgi:adenosine/AMP kinase